MWQTIGHDKAVNVLSRSLESGRLSHAYLLAGPRHVGKMTLAMDLAKALNCLEDNKPCGECGQCMRIDRRLHADVQVVGLEAGEPGEGPRRVAIGIDQVREVQREASLKPYEGRYRVFIFDEAERMSEDAANSLLKTLEEPPDQVVLVLLAPDAGALLPTLVSRCQVLELRPVPRAKIAAELEAHHGVDGARADEIARLSGGRPGWAISAAAAPEMLESLSEKLGSFQDIVQSGLEERFAYAASLASSTARNRESGRQELTSWLAWWRDVLLVNHGTPQFATHLSDIEQLKALAAGLSSAQVARAIGAIGETMEHLERNANPRLALENMMLEMPRPR